VGSRIVVAKGDRTGFDVFDPTGNKVGTVPATAAGAAAGDSSGGWLVTANDTLTRVDAAGRPAGQPVQLPNKSIASIAVGGGSLWVLEGRGTLSRLDPATGEVTGSVDVQVSQGLQVVWTRGAAFVASADYDLKRVDSATMKVTAVLAGHRGWSFQVLTVAADGSLWTEPAKGAIAQVDDKTLGVITFTSAFPNDREGGAFGAAISGDRVFLTDGDAATLHSFPLS
jgi:streptogramin lyase